MVALEKAGYILIGMGVGIFASAFLYEREMRKPIGEEEEYIPSEDLDDEGEANYIQEENVKELNDIYNKKPSYPEVNFAKKADSKNFKNDYSKMYKTSDILIEDELHNDSDYIQEDGPADDYPVEDILEDELITDRVEENFEILLGDNHPTDYDTLIFYQEDYTLCDDREQLIPNPENVVGEVALTRLIEGGPGAEEGTIFVRNLLTMITYEVVLDAGSYSETVLGIFESRGGGNAGNRR